MNCCRQPVAAFGVACVLLVFAAAAGCGKKGPPLAPLRPVPASVSEFAAHRLGSDVHLTFRIPDRNEDGTRPADVARVEVYAIGGLGRDRSGRPLELSQLRREGTLVGTIEVAPPGSDEGETSVPAGTSQGAVAVLWDRVAAVSLAASDGSRADERVRMTSDVPHGRRNPLGLDWLAGRDEQPVRSYVAVGISRRGRAGAPAYVQVPLVPAPPAPPAPALSYTEAAVLVTWEPYRETAGADPGGRQPGGAPPPAVATAPLSASPLLSSPAERRYNVYLVTEESSSALPVPLNQAPLQQPPFRDSGLEFGFERCYAVRAVQSYGNLRVESEASAANCVTPRDTFPPAAPRGLAAVGAAGAISLIWEPNEERDLAGYLVLRGEAPGETLQPLTPRPIRETTYRDAAVQSGVRYIYAVVALDDAMPPNVSPQSNRVEEIAR